MSNDAKLYAAWTLRYTRGETENKYGAPIKFMSSVSIFGVV